MVFVGGEESSRKWDSEVTMGVAEWVEGWAWRDPRVGRGC